MESVAAREIFPAAVSGGTREARLEGEDGMGVDQSTDRVSLPISITMTRSLCSVAIPM